MQRVSSARTGPERTTRREKGEEHNANTLLYAVLDYSALDYDRV
jgi:hypothetical protein